MSVGTVVRFMEFAPPCGEAAYPRERFFVETRKTDDGDVETSSRRSDEVFGGKDPRGGQSRSLGVLAKEAE
jgi:hypothetical protein